MGVSSIEEVIEGVRVGGVNLSVVDEVLSGVFGVVGPRVLWQQPHQDFSKSLWRIEGDFLTW